MNLTKEQLVFHIEKEICERSYYEFFKRAVEILEPSIRWKFNFHHKYLCDILDKEIERIALGLPKDQDYIVNIPPRTTKSLIFTVILNAWAWIKYPHLKFMTISYGEKLAVKLAYQTKLLIKSKWYQERWGDVFELSKDDSQKGSYSNDKGGSRESFGMSGGITGSGADVIIMDDPNKPKDISDVMLENVTDIFKDTVYNRLNNIEVGLRIIVQQRTHERDLSGFVLENYPDDFEHICLPMELADNIKPDYLASEYTDGLLHGERFNLKSILNYKKVLGSRNYAGQYKQKPVDEESAIIKKTWFNFIDKLTDDHKNITWHFIIDSAYTEKAKNDPSGIIIVGKFNNDLIISKAFKFHLAFPDLIKKIVDLMSQYGQRGTKIYIEPKASGISMVQQLKRMTKFNIIQMQPPKDSKEVRLNAASPTVESGRIFLVKDNWNDDFITEVSGFPVAPHDEYPDLLGYAIEELLNKQTQANYAFAQ